jgi:hypothetical protein
LLAGCGEGVLGLAGRGTAWRAVGLARLRAFGDAFAVCCTAPGAGGNTLGATPALNAANWAWKASDRPPWGLPRGFMQPHYRVAVGSGR